MSNTPVPSDIKRYLLNRLNAKAGFTLSLADVTFGNPILLDGTVLDFSDPVLRNSQVTISAPATAQNPAVSLDLRYNRLDLTKLFASRSTSFSPDLGTDLTDFIDAISKRVDTVVTADDFFPQSVNDNRLVLTAAEHSLRVIGSIILTVGDAVTPPGGIELVDGYLDLEAWSNPSPGAIDWRVEQLWNPEPSTRDYANEPTAPVNMVMANSTFSYLRPGWFNSIELPREQVTLRDGEFASNGVISQASKGSMGGQGMRYYVGMDAVDLMTNMVDQLPPEFQLPEGNFVVYPARYRAPWHSQSTGWFKATNQPAGEMVLYHSDIELYKGPALAEYIFDETKDAPNYSSMNPIDEFGEKLTNARDIYLVLMGQSDFTGQTSDLEFEVTATYAISPFLEINAQFVDVEYFTREQWEAVMTTDGDYAAPPRGTGTPHPGVLICDNGFLDNWEDRGWNFLIRTSNQDVQVDHTRLEEPFFHEAGLYVGTIKRAGQPDIRLAIRHYGSGGA